MVTVNLNINVEKGIDKSTLFLQGEIDIYTVPKLREQLLPLTERENHTTFVHMQEVSYLDSTGLGVFIQALKSTRKHQSQLRLIHLQGRIARLFKITGLNEIIHIEEVPGWNSNEL